MAKDTFYFPHDSNAHNDLKILDLRQAHGWQGYGLYWAILEILREQENYKIPINSKMSLMLALSLDEATLVGFIEDCLTIGLFIEKDGFLYSESFLNRMVQIDEKRGKLIEAGRRGGLISSQAKASLKQPLSSKVKESKVKESKYSFEAIWIKYPNKDGKKAALQAFNSSVKTDQDYDNIQKALENYLKSERVFNGFIKNSSTWFRNWQDWIDYKEEVCPKCKNKGKYTSSTGYEIICDCPKGILK